MISFFLLIHFVVDFLLSLLIVVSFLSVFSFIKSPLGFLSNTDSSYFAQRVIIDYLLNKN